MYTTATSIPALCLVAVLGVVLPRAAHAQEPIATAVAGSEGQVPRTEAIASPLPVSQFPPPPPRGQPRLFSATLLAGPGWLALHDSLGRLGQQATSLAGRVGVVVGPEWNLFLGLDHTRTERGGATFAQTAGLIGIQRFLFQRAYLGAGLGWAWVAESGVPGGLTDGPAGTASAHLGVELLRSTHTALSAEVSLTLARYSKESWEMGGVRLGLLLF